MLTRKNEQEIIRSFSKGSHSAFGWIYDAYKQQIYNFISKLVKTGEDVDELFQSVFVKLWEGRSNIDPDRGVEPYLYQISRNTVYTYLRKKINNHKLINSIEPDMPEMPDMLVQDKELSGIFRDLLGRLPEKRRKVFELRYMENLSYNEIADRLQISPKTVDNHLQAGISALRGLLGGEHTLLILMMMYFL